METNGEDALMRFLLILLILQWILGKLEKIARKWATWMFTLLQYWMVQIMRITQSIHRWFSQNKVIKTCRKAGKKRLKKISRYNPTGRNHGLYLDV